MENVPVDIENKEVAGLPKCFLSDVHPLNVGNFICLFSEQDYPLVSQYKWYPNRRKRIVYALAWISPGQHVYMHRLILGAKRGQYVDHIDGNGLNNLRHNIRICTQSENLANHRPRWDKKTSSHIGVSFQADRSKWRAQIQFHKKTINLGFFNTEIEAAEAYKIASLELHGEFSAFNGQLASPVWEPGRLPIQPRSAPSLFSARVWAFFCPMTEISQFKAGPRGETLMRMFLSELFAGKFFTKKRLDVDASFKAEDIGILRVFDAIPGDILLEFSSDEFRHIAEIWNIVEHMRVEREALGKKLALVPAPRPDPIQERFRFWEENQYQLFAA